MNRQDAIEAQGALEDILMVAADENLSDISQYTNDIQMLIEYLEDKIVNFDKPPLIHAPVIVGHSDYNFDKIPEKR